MSVLYRKPRRARVAKSRKSNEDASERFFSALKDMIELLGSWTLGAALMGAGIAMATSKFAIAIRLAGAFACIVMGTMVIVAAVLLYSRHRLVMHGHPVREQLKRSLKFILLMFTGLSVCVTTLDVLKQTTLTTKIGCGGMPTSEEQIYKASRKDQPVSTRRYDLRGAKAPTIERS